MTRKILTIILASVVATPFFGLTFSAKEIGVAPAEADAVCGDNGYSCGTSPSDAICCASNQSCCTSSTGVIYCGAPNCNRG